jgi:hypothetical protein
MKMKKQELSHGETELQTTSESEIYKRQKPWAEVDAAYRSQGYPHKGIKVDVTVPPSPVLFSDWFSQRHIVWRFYIAFLVCFWSLFLIWILGEWNENI